jgi:hypothetical protein
VGEIPTQTAPNRLEDTMTQYIPHKPPETMYRDTLLSYKAFAGPRMGAVVEPDPHGPVNKIVTLMAGERRVKSVLTRVPPGATLRVVHDNGGYSLDELYALRSGPGWRSLMGLPISDEPRPVRRLPGWYVEMGDQVLLHATESEVNPPHTWTPPPVPFRKRMRRALTEQLRADADAIAKRFGYHREDECEVDW